MEEIIKAGEFRWLPPKHKALGPYDPDRFPHQRGGDYQQQCAVVDTLTFTFERSKLILPELPKAESPDDPTKHLDETYLIAASVQVLEGLGIKASARLPSGRNFYKLAAELVTEGGYKNAGFIATGGNNDTVCVHITGKGCASIRSWRELQERLEKLGARISRVDLAHDDFQGAITVDDCLQMYLDGEFISRGRPPTVEQRGNWIQPDGRGRSLYVGRRQSGKMLRAYEKGKQQGDKDSPWVRWEVELHATDRVIPLEVLTRPGEYLKGTYVKAFEWMKGKASVIATYKRQVMLSYAAMVRHAKCQMGKLLNVMMAVSSDADEVIGQLIREGIPARLQLPWGGLDGPPVPYPPPSNTGGKSR